MGRPISKHRLGDPAQPGKQIVMTSAFVPGQVGPATGFYVLRQVGTGRYQVTNGSVTGHVRLVSGAEPLKAGEAVLEVSPFGKAKEHARMLHNRSVKTWEGNVYRWSLDPADEAGEADLPMA